MLSHQNKKISNNNSDIDKDLITLNNFFAHWNKEISITRYGSDKELPPTISSWEVYQYSDQMLKHLPTEALKTLQKTLLFSKKPVYFAKASFPAKIDYRIKLCLETNMDKLFESRKGLAANSTIPDVDAEIIFTRAPFIQYEQILLNKNFRQHLETIMVSKRILRMGAQKAPIQKTYEINTGSDSLNVEFLGSNRQFDWIEISIVPDKSDKHTTIYDSYNRELASQTIKTLQLTNFTEIYSLANEKKYDIDNLTQKHLLYKQFVAWNCNGSSVAPLTEYMNNPIFQELPDEDTYFSLKSDENVYLDLTASSGYVKEAKKLERNDSKLNLQTVLTNPATYKLRVRIWVYSISEYLYVLSRSGLTLKHRT